MKTLEIGVFIVDGPKHSLFHIRNDPEEKIDLIDQMPQKIKDQIEEGNLKYKLKRPWANGKTHVVFSPLEFIEKLCALVPQPRMHLVKYSGVLAPNSKMRKGVIPGMTRAEIKAKDKDKDKKLVSNHQWAKLLARVFEIDVSKCKYCGGN